MDRVISLLAALVGLIALGGALLVHTNADTQRREMATQIAQLKATIALNGQSQPAATPVSAPVQVAADNGVADALLALQDRIAALEQTTRDQSSQLEAARTQISAMPSTDPATQVGAIGAGPTSSAKPAAVVADGPTKDCIPLGTRFMASAGDSFPICKTKVVVKVASVDDGLATINGAGDVAAGGIGALAKGCNVAVFSADISSGYAEMRVTCQ
ncbi:MAG: hypothetical protein ABI398_06620 [Devosia sp.]